MLPFLKKCILAALAVFGIRGDRAVDGVVQTIYAADGKHRVCIYHRVNKTYGFQEEVFNDKLLEMRWEPAPTGAPDMFDSAEAALGAARGKVDWLRAEMADVEPFIK